MSLLQTQTSLINYSVSDVLPHGDLAILLDDLVAFEEDFLEAVVQINPTASFYDADMGGVPAWIGIEYMAQTVAAWAGARRLHHSKTIVPGFLLGAQRYECAQPVFLDGQKLTVKIWLQLESSEGLGSFNCEIIDESQVLVAEAVMNAFSPDDPSEVIQEWKLRG